MTSHRTCLLRSTGQRMIMCMVTSFVKGQLSTPGYLYAILMQQIFQFLSFQRTLCGQKMLNKEHERNHYHLVWTIFFSALLCTKFELIIR